jgi:hypothetical protein
MYILMEREDNITSHNAGNCQDADVVGLYFHNARIDIDQFFLIGFSDHLDRPLCQCGNNGSMVIQDLEGSGSTRYLNKLDFAVEKPFFRGNNF